MDLLKKRVYISGPITGATEEQLKAFTDAEKLLKTIGFEPVNPVTLGQSYIKLYGSTNEKDILLNDLEELGTCSTMVLLPGYGKSLGCITEIAFANFCGITIWDEFDANGWK